MKRILLQALIAKTILFLACSKENADSPSGSNEQSGIVKGRVVDTKGNPISGARVVIENTVFYASYVYATTDAAGYYKANVPNGSWHASVQIQKQFLDKLYNFDLSPDTDDDFAGTTGAVRNFTWKLSGPKPRSAGFYGSDVAVYSEPGSAFSMEDVELTLTPHGPLIDGSMGNTITKKLTDIGGGEDGIRDVPIGMYNITARNATTGEQLQIRLRNTGNYGNTVSGIFTSGFTGQTNYKIVVQVK